MAKHQEKKTLQWIELSKIVLNLSENVRDQVTDYDSIPALMNDIRDNGQKMAALYRKMSDGYHPLQGFRRTTAMFRLNQLYPEGYEYVNEVTGEKTLNKFDRVLAEVVECSDEEASVLKWDGGNIEPLSEIGVFNTMMEAFALHWTPKRIINNLRGIVDLRNPISAGDAKAMAEKVAAKLKGIDPKSPGYAQMKVAAEEDRYFLFRRGKIQKYENVFRCPIVVREAYVEKMRGNQKWPSDAEVAELKTIHEEEEKADPLNVTPINPGPKFLARWAMLVAAKESSEGGDGAVRPKATSMLGRQEVEGVESGSNSRLIKILTGIILRKYAREHLKPLDDLLVSMEASMDEGQKGKLADLIKVLTSVTVPAPTEVKVEEVAA